MNTEAERLVDLAEKCYRRVLKAEWTGTETRQYYCMALECGHHAHGTSEMLRAEVLCMFCLKERLPLS